MMRFVFLCSVYCVVSLCSVFAGVITVDFDEQGQSIADILSVDVAGPQDMTYCSLLTRINLERLTGWGSAQGFVEGSIPQGDAIRLIEEGLQTDELLGFVDPFVDIQSLFGSLDAYTLFDLYMYTPYPGETVTYHDYLLQGHRAVLLFADDMWWVLDTIRGGTRSRQTRDRYRQFLDPSTSLFVSRTAYRFLEEYLPDMHAPFYQATDFDETLQNGYITVMKDLDDIPLGYTLTNDLLITSPGAVFFGLSGTVITSADHSPFYLGLVQMDGDAAGAHLSFPGKQLVFSQPILLTGATEILDIPSISSTILSTSCPERLPDLDGSGLPHGLTCSSEKD